MVKQIGVLIVALGLAGPVTAETVSIGEPPPDVLGKSTAGEKMLVSDGVGRVQIVTFWATWCPPCMHELPVLDSIQRLAGEDRLRVVAVNLKESRQQFRRAMHAFKEFEVDFVHDRNGKVAEQYGVGAIPHMFIIAPDGTLATEHVGYGEAALGGIVDEINALLLEVTPGLTGATGPDGAVTTAAN